MNCGNTNENEYETIAIAKNQMYFMFIVIFDQFEVKIEMLCTDKVVYV